MDNSDDKAALEQAVKLAQAGEAWDYNRYWVAEHHDMSQLACTSPEVLLAHIGARTSRIRIGSGALLLPHYRPLKVAESFHLLASLYPDRIDLGIGRAPGGSAHAAQALSGNFIENISKLPQSLRSLTELLQGKYKFEGEPVTARPTPPVPPELWMLGTNRKSAGYAAEFGTGYVFGQFMSDVGAEEILPAYRDAFRPSELCPEPRIIIAVGAVCADTAEEANRLALTGAALFRKDFDPGGSPALDDRKVYIGSPAEVKERLERLSLQLGVDEFMIVTTIQDYEKRIRSYQLLSEIWRK
jgi:luciferase family oxidoreductase group 1